MRAHSLVLSLFTVLVACGSASDAEGRTPRARPAGTTPLAALCEALVTRIDAHASACGCALAAAEREELSRRCGLLYGVENGAPEPVVSEAAIDACTASLDETLGPGCVRATWPALCDLAVLTEGAVETFFASAGEPCNYAVCAAGLECRGDEEAACVTSSRARPFCGAPIALPSFVP